jgi:hypothetical protein
VKTSIDLKWSPPNVGQPTQYQVWRAECPKGTTAATCKLSPSVTLVKIANVNQGAPLCDVSFNYCDGAAKNGVLYIYLVTVTVDQKQSGPSNIVKQSR